MKESPRGHTPGGFVVSECEQSAFFPGLRSPVETIAANRPGSTDA